MAQKEFRIHQQTQADALQRAFDEKTSGNKAAGERQIREGTVKPFTGFVPERLRNEYNFTLELTPESQKEITDRVVMPLMQLAEQHGIQGIYPFHGDEPPHFTIDLTQFTNLSRGDRRRLWRKLNKDRYLDMIGRILTGIDVRLDSFVISGNAMYICVGEFNQDVVPVAKARNLIDKVVARTFESTRHQKRSSIQPATDYYKGILHATVGRITNIPADQHQLEAFANEANRTIGDPLKEEPIVATVSRAYHGDSFTYSKTRHAKFEREKGIRRLLEAIRLK